MYFVYKKNESKLDNEGTRSRQLAPQTGAPDSGAAFLFGMVCASARREFDFRHLTSIKSENKLKYDSH
jgi:hypothetical protein